MNAPGGNGWKSKSPRQCCSTEAATIFGSCTNFAIWASKLQWTISEPDTLRSAISRGFPFDKIKIDQSFVGNVDQRDAREIAKAIAALGQTLGMITTAEGVETQDHLDKMIEYGCIEVQGYLFSRPVPVSHLPGLLKSFNSGMRVA